MEDPQIKQAETPDEQTLGLLPCLEEATSERAILPIEDRVGVKMDFETADFPKQKGHRPSSLANISWKS